MSVSAVEDGLTWLIRPAKSVKKEKNVNPSIQATETYFTLPKGNHVLKHWRIWEMFDVLYTHSQIYTF